MTREEAIKELRGFIGQLTEGCQEAIKVLIPELCESEDEKIREEIVSFIRAFWVDHRDSVPQASKWLDWFEKQKEQTEELSTRLNGLMQEYVKSGKDEEEQEHRLKCYQLFWDALEDSEFFEQEEQKPAEWSEEDENMMNNIIRVLSTFVGTVECESNPSLSSSYPTYLREIDWLKSLKNRGNSPKSNTNSHREFSGSFMDYLDRNRPRWKMCLSNGECKNIDDAFQRKDWAMLLRYAKKYGVLESWRPSEEQMRALEGCVNYLNESDNEDYEIVESLYEDLKKLM